MASGFYRALKETYVVTVRAQGRGRRKGAVLVSKRFDHYQDAMLYCSDAEQEYGREYTVEFDTKFAQGD